MRWKSVKRVRAKGISEEAKKEKEEKVEGGRSKKS